MTFTVYIYGRQQTVKTNNMKQFSLLVLSLLAITGAFAQSSPKEPISAPPSAALAVKHDTIVKQLLILQVNDTIPVYLIYAGPNNQLLYDSGFYLRSGLKANGTGEFVKVLSIALVDSKYGKPRYKVIDTKNR